MCTSRISFHLGASNRSFWPACHFGTSTCHRAFGGADHQDHFQILLHNRHHQTILGQGDLRLVVNTTLSVEDHPNRIVELLGYCLISHLCLKLNGKKVKWLTKWLNELEIKARSIPSFLDQAIYQ